jgi:hypothetical protein
VELETNSTGRTGEASVGNFTLTTGGNTFTFPGNAVPGPSGATQWLLLATMNFASQPGAVAPDFVIPPNFFVTGGGTINYASGVDSWTYGTVPTDGVHALARDPDTQVVSTIVNRPVNILGNAGQIGSAPTPALGSWAVALGIGAMLLAASGLLRRRSATAA